MTANPHRGEASLQVGGEVLVLRPSFSALVAAEEELGPLFALVERASEGRLALGEIEDYQLSFESGEKMQGQFLVTRLEYAGDFNGERNYTLALESSGAVASL